MVGSESAKQLERATGACCMFDASWLWVFVDVNSLKECEMLFGGRVVVVESKMGRK